MHHAARGAVISIDHEQMPQAHQRPLARTAFNPKVRETPLIVIPANAGIQGLLQGLAERRRHWMVRHAPAKKHFPRSRE
ncbi:hypothetical protein [Pseudoxanthomonas sp. UC19_8]|uniref:hypothetical protein n=1 Tax=Pseudoxanthomonas sp. UC19_8 TaxID=3350175 RepID=UPI0036D34A49